MSVVEKPVPETSMIAPSEPELGLREMDGTVTGSVELAVTIVVDETEEVLVRVVA